MTLKLSRVTFAALLSLLSFLPTAIRAETRTAASLTPEEAVHGDRSPAEEPIGVVPFFRLVQVESTEPTALRRLSIGQFDRCRETL